MLPANFSVLFYNDLLIVEIKSICNKLIVLTEPVACLNKGKSLDISEK